MEEHIIWWNKLTKERRQEINEIHFSCNVGEESDFDIHRAFTNLYIKQLSNHETWWNSLTHARKAKLAMTYFNFEDYGFLKDEEIQHIFTKVKNHKTVVNVKPEKKKVKIVKLPQLVGKEKYTQIRDDLRTTMLGLSQCLIYMFDKLGTEKSIFRQELKHTGNAFMKELEKNMNFYFKLNKEEQYAQADLLNLLCNSIEHNVKLAYRASEMEESTCDMFLKDYKALMNKYGIENDFLNENSEQK